VKACCGYLIKQAVTQAQMNYLTAQYDAQEKSRLAARRLRQGQTTPFGGGNFGRAATRGLKIGLPLAGLGVLGYGLSTLT